MHTAVIPVYNEAESLPELHRQLVDVAQANGLELEILFIDDGSKDESWPVIEKLARLDDRVRGLRFRRNFGKAAAQSVVVEVYALHLVLLVALLDLTLLAAEPQRSPGTRTTALVLLAYGADPQLADPKGNTPMSIAEEYGHELAIRLLRRYLAGDLLR